jgi:hypothetical protein
MRVYVNPISVYFAFDDSMNTQIFAVPGQYNPEVMAGNNQGFIS